jgi:very-short-patch-repair endonuclease
MSKRKTPKPRSKEKLDAPDAPATHHPNLEKPFGELWKKLAEPLEKEHSIELSLQHEVSICKLIAFDDRSMTKHHVDFYCSELKLTIEIHGATHKGRNGAHSSALGIRRDMHKQRLLTLSGYKHLELDAPMSRDAQLIQDTLDVLVKEYLGYPTISIPNPIHYSSWANNATEARKLMRETKRLEKWLEANQHLDIIGSTQEVRIGSAIRSSTALKLLPKMGYEKYLRRFLRDCKYGDKIIQKPATQTVWRKAR